ncbi:aldose 1-epimerase [Paenibacillus campinasensis]|uniref:Aldose 1-epimerase n=1 Tax=Paenibacillus campinasensis TaxID=66347 RepID=A0ABW9SZL4_9BACL|nr:aldose 1-epimerase [Paenibacillus campinasensis]MUG66458.1 aldose 1-epimerase [Paenibacillus campinasensis]
MNQVTKGQWNGYDTYTLNSGRLEVTLLPRLGNNVIEIKDKDNHRQVLRKPDETELAFYLQKPYHFGIPMLIPPGRIDKGRFEYGGVEYQFEQNTANDNHIHGLHRTQAWCVSDIEEDDEGCAVTTEFVTSDDPKWIAQFPEPLKLEMNFRLQNNQFIQTLRVHHMGKQPVPFGLGYHTWFLLDGQPQNWTLQLPVEAIYTLNSELLPTGDTASLGHLQPLNSGMNLKEADLETILKIPEGQPAEAVLTRNDGYQIRYSADRAYFKHWVLYTKGIADQFLCIEPYTWLPNAPNLDLPDSETGLIRLEPESMVELRTKLTISSPESEA